MFDLRFDLCLFICLPTGSRKHTEDDAAQIEGGGEGSDEEFL